MGGPITLGPVLHRIGDFWRLSGEGMRWWLRDTNAFSGRFTRPVAASVKSVQQDPAVTVMDCHPRASTPTDNTPGWPGRLAYVVIIGLGYLLTWPILAGYSVHINQFRYVKPTGAFLMVVVAVLSSYCFIRCPRRPLWFKGFLLLAILPSLHTCVDAVARYWIYGRWLGAF